MRLAVVASALMLVATSCCALAQGASPRESPVGHRQPKAGSLPQDQQTPAERKQQELDKVLDKKLKGICRGC
jgi:hypothetical protein